MSFTFAGDLSSFSNYVAQDLIFRNGGNVETKLNMYTTHIVLSANSAQSKPWANAGQSHKFDVERITEEEFVQLTQRLFPNVEDLRLFSTRNRTNLENQASKSEATYPNATKLNLPSTVYLVQKIDETRLAPNGYDDQDREDLEVLACYSSLGEAVKHAKEELKYAQTYEAHRSLSPVVQNSTPKASSTPYSAYVKLREDGNGAVRMVRLQVKEVDVMDKFYASDHLLFGDSNENE
jgi:hypothetical protein